MLHNAMYLQGINDMHQMAYVCATARHESNNFRNMYEIGSYNYFKQYDGRLGNIVGTEDFYTYRGRGYVQLTGRANYDSVGKALGLDLVNNPDLAADRQIAAKITAYGMKTGKFTGVGLSLFINEDTVDYLNARKIINGDVSTIGLTVEAYAESYEFEIVQGLKNTNISVFLDGIKEEKPIYFVSGSDNDTFYGGKGNDKLDGGADNDILTGGEGADIYILSSGAADEINDIGEDDVIWANADGDIFAGEAKETGEVTAEGIDIYLMNGAELQDVDGDLVIRRGADVTYVRNWVEGEKIAANNNIIIDKRLKFYKIAA